jgi:hypothetical protein
MYQAVHGVEYLVAQAGLANGARARGNHQRPQDGGSDQANRAHGGFIYPFLLPDHRHDAARSALENYAQSCLKTDQGLQVAAFLQLYHYLVSTADLLHLVALDAVHIFKIIGEPFNIYFFAIVKPGIHSSLSFRLVLLAL